jgi:hypothetical protein
MRSRNQNITLNAVEQAGKQLELFSLSGSSFDRRYLLTGSSVAQRISSSLVITGSVQITSSQGNVLTILGDSNRGVSKALKVVGGSPQIRFGENIEDTGAVLMSFSDNDFIAAGGADFSGTWSAKSTTGAGYIRIVNGGFTVWLSHTVTVSGSDPIFTASISSTALSGTLIKGTTTNNDAAAGYVGEYIEATAADASVTGWANGTFKTITSINLTSGDWDIEAVAMFGGSGGNITGTNTFATISQVTNSNESNVFAINESSIVPLTTVNVRLPVPKRRLALTASQTVYLVGRIVFTGGTPTAGGWLYARRVR